MHTVPHDAADGLVRARVVDVGDGNGGGACGSLDLGKAEVVDQLGAGDGRGSRPGRIRDTFQHLQAGLFGGSVVAQHHAVDAAAHGIGGGQGQCGGLLHDDAAALEPRRAHPCLTGAHLHAQAALCRDGKILLGAVYAAQAGGEVTRSVVGIVGNAVFGVSNDISHKVLLFRSCASWAFPAGLCGWCRCPRSG